MKNQSPVCKRKTNQNIIILSLYFVTVIINSGVLGLRLPTKKSDNEQPDLAIDSSIRLIGSAWLSNVSFAGYNLCLTPGCISTANFVLRNMDANVDPCDDFYQFACGRFITETPMPPKYKPVTSTSSTIEMLLRKQLNEILTEPVTDTDIRPYKLAKYLHQACINEDKIEEVGLEPAKNMLKKLGGWPVLEEDWSEQNFSWMESVYRFHNKGFSVDYFFDFSIGINPENSTVRVMYLTPANLALRIHDSLHGLKNKNVAAYYKYMVETAVMFGAHRDRAINELKESLDFEITLASISVPQKNNSSNTTKSSVVQKMNITELQRTFPSIPWLEYINTILAPNTQINETEVAIVFNPLYFSKLEKLLETTPKRIQANYVMWRATASTIRFLNSAVRKQQVRFRTISLDNVLPNYRWYECVEVMVYSRLNLAIGSMYIKRYFKNSTKRDVLDMVKDIRQEMYKILTSVDWMDNQTRKNALDKAHTMINHIAYPDELLIDSELVKFYDKLNINSQEYYNSMLNLIKFGTDTQFSKLKKPVNKTDWTIHGSAAVVNAFYYPFENSIEFPAGILQRAFFRSDRPRYINYGAIGSVIGHEITHAFDNQGSQFDKNGNFFDWWEDPKTKDRFLEKAKCIINQYSNYTEAEVNMTVDGVKTQGENIADNGGIKQAYYAYLKWAKKNPTEPRLPRLQKYTPPQMFWISAANLWCSRYRPEALKHKIISDIHPPDRFRVIGPFSNQKEFARDFGCSPGSKMNPVQKCEVW